VCHAWVPTCCCVSSSSSRVGCRPGLLPSKKPATHTARFRKNCDSLPEHFLFGEWRKERTVRKGNWISERRMYINTVCRLRARRATVDGWQANEDLSINIECLRYHGWVEKAQDFMGWEGSLRSSWKFQFEWASPKASERGSAGREVERRLLRHTDV